MLSTVQLEDEDTPAAAKAITRAELDRQFPLGIAIREKGKIEDLGSWVDISEKVAEDVEELIFK
ncbi:hypothetical protein BGZ65_009273 [Modicella reniformis]|uniref:Uncharacterized protein n=1 Tax=Modicella reniformis TaxID=1440133 RepID=A0A9P6LS09_9FUNG|nr:hypothetical protein BGZ65_009273 [Modicella reniformis]